MELTILGTASMVPTKERNVQAFFLEYKGEGILFDCGEGAQRQMNIAGINRLKVKKILISHWHGDHVAGIIGLLQTIGNGLDDAVIHIYGPVGTKIKMDHVMKSVDWDVSVDVQVHELEKTNDLKSFYENDDYILEYISLDHKSECVGYNFVEKDRKKVDMSKVKALGLSDGPWLQDLLDGKVVKREGVVVDPEKIIYIIDGRKFSLVADTCYCENILKLVDGADVALCECTLMMDKADRAEKVKHMTTKQVADVANFGNVKRVIATHFSQRYKDIGDLEVELKDFAPDAECAHDFMKVRF